MKNNIPITMALCISLNIAVAADSATKGPKNGKAQDNTNMVSQAVIAGKVAALNQKYPLLFNADSDRQEAKCKEAMSRLADDPELTTLRAKLKEALPASGRGSKPQQISIISEELQKKQFEKIAAIYPDLKPYLEAKAAHQKERMTMLRENAGNPAAQKLVMDQAKRPKVDAP